MIAVEHYHPADVVCQFLYLSAASQMRLAVIIGFISGPLSPIAQLCIVAPLFPHSWSRSIAAAGAARGLSRRGAGHPSAGSPHAAPGRPGGTRAGTSWSFFASVSSPLMLLGAWIQSLPDPLIRPIPLSLHRYAVVAPSRLHRSSNCMQSREDQIK